MNPEGCKIMAKEEIIGSKTFEQQPIKPNINSLSKRYKILYNWIQNFIHFPSIHEEILWPGLTGNMVITDFLMVYCATSKAIYCRAMSRLSSELLQQCNQED